VKAFLVNADDFFSASFDQRDAGAVILLGHGF
jgi:hypothetical protein